LYELTFLLGKSKNRDQFVIKPKKLHDRLSKKLVNNIRFINKYFKISIHVYRCGR